MTEVKGRAGDQKKGIRRFIIVFWIEQVFLQLLRDSTYCILKHSVFIGNTCFFECLERIHFSLTSVNYDIIRIYGILSVCGIFKSLPYSKQIW